MKLLNLLMGIALVSIFMISGIIYITEVSTKYSKNVDSTGFEKTQSAIDYAANFTDTQMDHTMNITITPEENQGGVPFDWYKRVSNFIQKTGAYINIIPTMYGEMIGSLSKYGIVVPRVVSIGVPIIITIIVLIIIISALINRDLRA